MPKRMATVGSVPVALFLFGCQGQVADRERSQEAGARMVTTGAAPDAGDVIEVDDAGALRDATLPEGSAALDSGGPSEAAVTCGANGFALCDGGCTDILTDPQNCGRCGNVCIPDPCANGVCQQNGGW
jgi:hypothetical protein